MTEEEGRVIMELVVSGAVEYKGISFNLRGHKLYQKIRNVLLRVPPRCAALSSFPVAVSVKFSSVSFRLFHFVSQSCFTSLVHNLFRLP